MDCQVIFKTNHDDFGEPNFYSERCGKIDDYVEDGGPGDVWFLCSVYHESLLTWIKTIVNKFAISNQTALISGVHALKS